MAFSLDTSGFNVTVPQGSAPLESLKPFVGAGAAQMDIKPTAGWNTPSSHPEFVAQGIAQGVGAITQGIQVAYQQKRQEAKEALAAQKEQDKYEQQQRAEAFKEQQWRDRLAGVLPNGRNTAAERNYAPIPSATPTGSASPTTSTPQKFQFTAPLDYTGAGPLADTGAKPKDSAPMANATIPEDYATKFLSATYSPLAAMAGVKPEANVVVPPAPQFKYNASEGANIGAWAQDQQAKQAASETAAPKALKGSPEFRAFPPTDEGYRAAVAESQKEYEGYGTTPKVVMDPKENGYRVDWQHADESKKQRMLNAQQNSVRREQSSFYAQPEIKNFTAANGVRQAFPRFMADYEAGKKHPEAAGIHDIGLLDMYARAEAGGRVTEGQAKLALEATSLADKAKLLGLRLIGGDHLAPDQRDAMARVMVENHNMGARLANQNIVAARDRLMSEGITDEKQLPQPYKLAQSREMIIEQINELKNQALATKDKSQRDRLLSEAQQLSQQAAGKKGLILNLEEMLDSRQGYGGGVPTMMIQQGQETAQ